MLKSEDFKSKLASILSTIKNPQERQNCVKEIEYALKGKATNFSKTFKKRILPLMLAMGMTLSPMVLTACDENDTPKDPLEAISIIPHPQAGEPRHVNRFDAPPQNPEMGKCFEGVRADGMYKNPFLVTIPTREELGGSYMDYIQSIMPNRITTDHINEMKRHFYSIKETKTCNIKITLAGSDDSFIVRYSYPDHNCYLEYNGNAVYGVKNGEFIDNLTGTEYEKYKTAFPIDEEYYNERLAWNEERKAEGLADEFATKNMMQELAGAFLYRWKIGNPMPATEDDKCQEYYFALKDEIEGAGGDSSVRLRYIARNSMQYNVDMSDIGAGTGVYGIVSSFQIVAMGSFSVATGEDGKHFTEYPLATVDVEWPLYESETYPPYAAIVVEPQA